MKKTFPLQGVLGVVSTRRGKLPRPGQSLETPDIGPHNRTLQKSKRGFRTLRLGFLQRAENLKAAVVLCLTYWYPCLPWNQGSRPADGREYRGWHLLTTRLAAPLLKMYHECECSPLLED